MRDRLVELIGTSGCVQTWDYYTDDFKKPNPIYELADHLIAEGVIVPPVRVGQTVWGIRNYHSIKHPQEGKVSEMYFTEDMRLLIKIKHICIGEWGKTVFLSREDAEKALKGGAE
jgi:hypothetical protein